MPVCFQLFPKNDPSEAIRLDLVDEELCRVAHTPTHPTMYVYAWFDFIGFRLACGKSFLEISDDLRDLRHAIQQDVFRAKPTYTETQRANMVRRYNMLDMFVNYLDYHYTVNSFYSRY